MDETQEEPRKRASRTVRKAAAGGQLRPLLIGGGVVAVLVVVIVVAGRYDRIASRTPPPPEVRAGRIQVDGTEVLPARGGGAEEAAWAPEDGSKLPVQFYQVLGEGRERAAPEGGEIERRSLPLPPPPDAAPPRGQAAVPVPAARQASADARPRTAALPAAPAPAMEEAVEPTPAAESASTESAPAEEASAAPAAGSAATDKPYTLQVGSFSRRDRADDLAERLKGRGFEPYLVTVDLGKRGVWWRVRVGRYPTEYSAKWARLDLVKEGLSPIVVRDRATP